MFIYALMIFFALSIDTEQDRCNQKQFEQNVLELKNTGPKTLGDTVGNMDELVDWADKVKEAAIYPHLTKPLPSLDINKFLEDFGASGM